MVKLFLPNSASPGQESQKCLKNKCTALVTSRKTRSFVTSRSQKNFVIGHLALCDARGDQWQSFFFSARGDQRRSFSMSARWWKTEFSARWPKLCTYFRDIFGSPGQGGPSWAKWVSPLNSSMKTTTFKPNLYFYHRIPLNRNFWEQTWKQKLFSNFSMSKASEWESASFAGSHLLSDVQTFLF